MNSKYMMVAEAIDMIEMSIKDPIIINYLKHRPKMIKQITSNLAKKGEHLALGQSENLEEVQEDNMEEAGEIGSLSFADPRALKAKKMFTTGLKAVGNLSSAARRMQLAKAIRM